MEGAGSDGSGEGYRRKTSGPRDWRVTTTEAEGGSTRGARSRYGGQGEGRGGFSRRWRNSVGGRYPVGSVEVAVGAEVVGTGTSSSGWRRRYRTSGAGGRGRTLGSSRT